MFLAEYRIEFNIAGIVILLSLFRYYFQLIKGNKKSKVFIAYTIFTIVYLSVEIAQVMLNNKSETYPLWVLYGINTLFFLMHFAMPLYFMDYSMHMFKTGFDMKALKRLVLLSILGIVAMLATIFVNPFYHWLFYFNDARQYTHGTLHILSYIVPLFHLAEGVIYIAVTKNVNNKSKVVTIVISSVLILSAAVLQYFFPFEILTGFAVSLSMLFMFLSFHDPNEQLDSLTGLFNKETFTNEINDRVGKRQTYIYSMAVNNFTKINSTYGTEIGNEVLKSLASIFLKSSQSVFKYRYGGDRFVGIAQTMAEARNTIYKIKQDLGSVLVIESQEIEVSVRFSIIPNDSIESLEYLVRQVDYVNKEAKKEEMPIYVLSDIINQRLKNVIREEKIIHRSIENNEIEVYLQPIYDVKSKKFTKAEALLRIKDEDGSFINPEVAIKYAENKGLMVKLGYDIMERVFKFVSSNDIRKLGVEKIGINLSMIQCIQPTLYSKTTALAKQYSIDPKLICFEITETQSASNESELLSNMNRLIRFGFEFSLDDYGSGYSTIDYIISLPFTTVKIDQRIIMMMEEGNESHKIVSYTVKMLHDVGKEIVVEGVESSKTDGYIKKLNVEYVQGFFYSRPLPMNEYLKFINEKNA